MLLKSKSTHISINRFPEKEIEDFSIFTGLNGSGKSHLLDAIKENHVQVDDILTDEIAFFDYGSFKIQSDPGTTLDTTKREKMQLWKMFSIPNGNNSIWRDHFLNLRKQIPPEHIEILQKKCIEKNKSLMELNLEDLGNDVFENLKTYRERLKSMTNNTSRSIDNRIFDLAFQYNGFLDDITRDQFIEKITLHTAKHHFFTNEISKVFMNFHHLCVLEYHKQIELNSKQQVIPDKLKSLAMENTVKKFEGTTPWDFINNLFQDFENFKYRISEPPKIKYGDLDETTNEPFIVKLYNESTDISIDFTKLSSGEQTLLTITIAMLNLMLNNHVPKLVLLDEIDSSLHPSMTKSLLSLLEKISLTKNIKIILVTHSPSTVAFAPKNSVYLIDNTSPKLITESNSQVALQSLTEGFFTIHDTHMIFDELNKFELTIFSEGNNVMYLDTAIGLYLDQQSIKVNVWKGIEGKSSVGQLVSLYYLLNSLNQNKKKILFVFDCKATPDSFVKDNVEKSLFVITLPNNDNGIVDKGIEAMLPASAFNGFMVETLKQFTNEKNITFPDNNKPHLCKKLCSDKNLDIFEVFKPFTEQVKKILAE